MNEQQLRKIREKVFKLSETVFALPDRVTRNDNKIEMDDMLKSFTGTSLRNYPAKSEQSDIHFLSDFFWFIYKLHLLLTQNNPKSSAILRGGILCKTGSGFMNLLIGKNDSDNDRLISDNYLNSLRYVEEIRIDLSRMRNGKELIEEAINGIKEGK